MALLSNRTRWFRLAFLWLLIGLLIGGSAASLATIGLVFGWAVVDSRTAAGFGRRVVATGDTVALVWRFQG